MNLVAPLRAVTHSDKRLFISSNTPAEKLEIPRSDSHLTGNGLEQCGEKGQALRLQGGLVIKHHELYIISVHICR
jgi:hypothetical protein